MAALAIVMLVAVGWCWRSRGAALRRAIVAEGEVERLRRERRAAEVRAVKAGRVERS
jgi:hypothetical protein